MNDPYNKHINSRPEPATKPPMRRPYLRPFLLHSDFGSHEIPDLKIINEMDHEVRISKLEKKVDALESRSNSFIYLPTQEEIMRYGKS